MSSKAVRGTKRTCQNSSCGSRFYDLMRDPIACPICGTGYVVAVAAPQSAAALAAARQKAPIVQPQPDFEMADDAKSQDGSEAVPEEALADIEGGDEPVVVADDETFLEEEEGGDDVAGIVSGGEEPEEQ